MSTPEKALRICPLCEATCGLELDISGRTVTAVRGNSEDVFSEGYLCPKGVALKDLDADPDRLRQPMVRRDGRLQPATWEEAFSEIERRLMPIRKEHGRDAVAMYLGNPNVHNTSLMFYAPALRSVVATKNVFTASSVDQVPKQLAVGLMFGDGISVPIPDIDRCQHLVIIGANPLVSNGSLMTAPNFADRMNRLRARGGKVVVIDPVRTRTAAAADDHHFIQPGSDAFLLFAVVHTLIAEELTDPGRLAAHTNGIDQIQSLAEPFSADAVAEKCGIDADVIRTLAREIAAADSAAVYGRLGTCTQEFGTLTSWLAEVIHVLTGNLDREGGAMFTLAAHGPTNSKNAPGAGRGFRMGKWKSRVRGCSEIFSELPVSCLSEEIETPGADKIRALITIAGNPVLSTPNGARLSAALESLDFMVSCDLYLNETTRHADVILPGLSPLESIHYDAVFSQLAVRNTARFSPAVFAPPTDHPGEWKTLLRLASIISEGQIPAEPANADVAVLHQLMRREMKPETSTIHGRDPAEILRMLEPRTGPERVLDFLLRTGPYGDAFGAKPDGLTLGVLEEQPHGVDLGALKPRLPEVIRNPSGKIELAPDLVVKDVARLREGLNGDETAMVLIGRRHLRSNNSWMHNIPQLVSGKPRCTLQLNPVDADRLGLKDKTIAQVTSRAGSLEIPVELTKGIRPGVASIPHGWGHSGSEIRMTTALANAGVNSNLLADELNIDMPSGNAVLSGIPIEITPAAGSFTARSQD